MTTATKPKPPAYIVRLARTLAAVDDETRPAAIEHALETERNRIPGKTPESVIDSLVIKHKLGKITLTGDGQTIWAHAYMDTHSARYTRKVEARFTVLAHERGNGEFSIREVTRIRQEVAEGPIAYASAKTIAAALEALTAKLTALDS